MQSSSLQTKAPQSMAPLPPPKSKPPSKSTPSSLPSSSYRTPHRITKFPLKRVKLLTKHTALLSRLTPRPAHPNPQSKPTPTRKKRRPSKKLVANLDSLVHALPDTTDNANADAKIPSSQGRGSKTQKMMAAHQSLKSRPGATRKKEAIVAMERERFARNLAQMAGSTTTATTAIATGKEVEGAGESEMAMDGDAGVERRKWEGEGGGEGKRESGSADRWAAIRGFIRERMERSGGVEGK